MESILDVWLLVFGTIKLFRVGIVFGKHELREHILGVRTATWGRRQLEEACAEFIVFRLRSHGPDHANVGFELVRLMTPGPGIAEPHVWDDMQGRWLWTPVVGSHTKQQFFWVASESMILNSRSCLPRLAFSSINCSLVRNSERWTAGLLTMCWRVIEVKVRLLDTLAMIALGIAETKESFLQEVILFVPESKCHVLQAVAVAHTCNPVFAPTVGPGPGLVVREMAPCIPVVGVVLADGCPLPFRYIRAPFLPVFCAFAVFFQPLLFLTEVFVVVDYNHLEEHCREPGWFWGSLNVQTTPVCSISCLDHRKSHLSLPNGIAFLLASFAFACATDLETHQLGSVKPLWYSYNSSNFQLRAPNPKNPSKGYQEIPGNLCLW
ncbi:family 63 glycoside hydrolase, partial [Aureobasidium melanogenum]